MDHASSLDRGTPMTAKNNNNATQPAAAVLQLNTSLVRTLADTRRDSAVAIASAEVEVSTPSNNRNSGPSTMPQAPENPGLGPQERVGTQQEPGQEASTDTTSTALNASDKEPKKTKKKKKKASKSPSSGLSADQPSSSSAQQASPSTVEDTSQSLSSTAAAAPAKQDHSPTAMVVDSETGALTEESLEWLESAVVRGDTKPTGKKPKAKKKPASKKTSDRHTSSTPSSVKGGALSENEEEQPREQEDDEGQRIHERTRAESIPTLTTSRSGASSPSHDDPTILTPKDDLAFLEDDFLGNGGSGNWADDVDEYVCQTAGSTLSIAVSRAPLASSSNMTAPSSTYTPQESASASAILAPKQQQQPSQDLRRSGTAEERVVDRAPWGHSKKSHLQQQPHHSSTHHHAPNQNDHTGRYGTQEQYRSHPTRHQEHNKQQQAPVSQKSHQRSLQVPRPTLTRHQTPPRKSKPHADHPPSHQLGARNERSSSSTKAAGNFSNRPSKQLLDPSIHHKQPQAARTPEMEWDDRDKIVQLLSSRWNAALASVGKEDTDSAVYYSSS
ncbi:hypothetical protein BGZ67_005211 [Mortierella alpina]|nr:hypothetical protein BGZ67_005211 [Mortierella alpina]